MTKLDEISFDESGITPVVMQDAETGEVLTLAYANHEAVEKTLQSGEAHFYSRSRGALWRKGETSGNSQKVAEVRLDCDSDALLYKVHPRGPACHTGENSCFYTTLAGEGVGVEKVSSGTETAGAMMDRLAVTVSERRRLVAGGVLHRQAPRQRHQPGGPEGRRGVGGGRYSGHERRPACRGVR